MRRRPRNYASLDCEARARAIRGLAIDHRTVDAAWSQVWSPKFGVVSAGTPETAATAARQDVVQEAAKVLA